MSKLIARICAAVLGLLAASRTSTGDAWLIAAAGGEPLCGGISETAAQASRLRNACGCEQCERILRGRLPDKRITRGAAALLADALQAAALRV